MTSNTVVSRLQSIRQVFIKTLLVLCMTVSPLLAIQPVQAVTFSNDYPDMDAVDCSSNPLFGQWSWCKEENGTSGYQDGEQRSSRLFWYRNCTDGVAYWVKAYTGVTIPGSWGNATSWDTNATNYTVKGGNSNDIEPGDIAQSDTAAGGVGHVGFVTDVTKDSSGVVTSIKVAELNHDGDGEYNGVATYSTKTNGYFKPYANDRWDHFIDVNGANKGLNNETWPEAVSVDTDGDGVLDNVDDCDTQQGPVWRNGCPIRFSLSDGGMASGDFDSDGYIDTAIGAPGEDLAGPGSGNVHIIYGTADGLSETRHSRITQGGYSGSDVVNTSANSVEAGDYFGATLTVGDFNNDNYDDLAIGAPGETIASQPEGGLVHILYGSNAGLTSSSQQQVISQGGYSATGIVNTTNSVEANDFFGAELAVGDIDGDNYDDLLVGVPGEDLSATPVADVGIVHLLYGSASGFTSRQNTISQSGYTTTGIVNTNDTYEAGDNFGNSLATGDFNKDGKDDILIGAVGEDLGVSGDAGFVHLLYGSTSGPVATGQKVFVQGGYTGSDAVILANSTYSSEDYLGASLAVGDMNGDTYPDIIMGAPGEDFGTGTTTSEGAVFIVYNSSGTFATGNSQHLFAQQGVTGTGVINSLINSIEPYDLFGSSLAVGDIDGDGYVDLAVGAPGETVGQTDVYAGFVHVAYGSSTGLGSRQQLLSQGGYSGTSVVNFAANLEANDLVGTDLLMADFDSDGKADMLTAAPGEDLGSAVDAGLVLLSYGSADGFGSRQYSLSQSSYSTAVNIEVTGTVESGDNFGGGIPGRLFW